MTRSSPFARVLGSLGVVVAAVAAVASCSSAPAICRGAQCTDAVDASPGAGDAKDDGPPPPPGCDPEADAMAAPACMVDAFAVFVDGANGADDLPGTKAAPVRTIGEALKKRAGRSRIYLCAATYAERVEIAAPVSLFGGFTCGAWTYSGERAKLVPGERGVVLRIADATAPVAYSDLELDARDGLDPGESSIAMFVANAARLTLRRMKLTAGKGVRGANGANADPFTGPAPSGHDGAGTADVAGIATPNPLCPTSIGGAGGAAKGNTLADGLPGRVAPATSIPLAATGLGGSSAGCVQSASLGVGVDGSGGPGGAAGAGATRAGALAASGWKPGDGADGGEGTDGQGGGGGGRDGASSAIGGGGGAGGCGGAGGARGQTGGSSIALAVFESAVEAAATTFTASDAEDGGAGGKGQRGQDPGTRGEASDSIKACDGGRGGRGGSGGGGGGGAGGLSIGVLYTGLLPRLDGAEVGAADTHAAVQALGTSGEGGDGGPEGGDPPDSATIAGAPGSKGIAGQARAVLGLPK